MLDFIWSSRMRILKNCPIDYPGKNGEGAWRVWIQKDPECMRVKPSQLVNFSFLQAAVLEHYQQRKMLPRYKKQLKPWTRILTESCRAVPSPLFFLDFVKTTALARAPILPQSQSFSWSAVSTLTDTSLFGKHLKPPGAQNHFFSLWQQDDWDLCHWSQADWRRTTQRHFSSHWNIVMET